MAAILIPTLQFLTLVREAKLAQTCATCMLGDNCTSSLARLALHCQTYTVAQSYTCHATELRYTHSLVYHVQNEASPS